MLRKIFLLLFVLGITSCSNKREHLNEKYFGIYIDHYPRQGSGYTDSLGIKYWFFSVKTVITNDSLIPAKVTLSLPTGCSETIPFNGKKYKVFLLPDSMAYKQTGDNYSVSDALKKVLDAGMENRFILNKILMPKEECTVYIGFIGDLNEINPYLSLFSRGHRLNFMPSRNKNLAPPDSLLSIPDSAINKLVLGSENQLNLFLAMRDLYSIVEDPLKSYAIIPCGQISFFNQ
jgi:hypothetical protein